MSSEVDHGALSGREPDEVLHDRVVRAALAIRRRRRLYRACAVGVVACTSAGVIYVTQSGRGDESVKAVAPTEDDARLRLTASDLLPSVGEPVTFTATEEGGAVVELAMIDVGDPAQPPAAVPGGPTAACGHVSDEFERRTEMQWAYTVPGTYEVAASMTVADPCAGTREPISTSITVVVSAAGS